MPLLLNSPPNCPIWKGNRPSTFGLAQCMKTKVEALDPEYNGYHYAVIDLIDDEGELGTSKMLWTSMMTI